MASERTPLLETVPVAEFRERYSHSTIRRYCTITLVSVPALTIVILLLCIWLAGEQNPYDDRNTFPNDRYLKPPHDAWPQPQGLSMEKLMSILLDTPNAESAKASSEYYTSGLHLAGKNLSQAEWTRDRWLEWGVNTAEVIAYDVYLNYPVDHAMALLEDDDVKFRATLEEDIINEDPTTSAADRVPEFHGYSANGNVTAQYIFCNYGTYQDFQDLQDAGIDLAGKIALIKYGAIFRGLKIKRASQLGMVGALLYDDPGNDGEITEKNGYKPYPEGPARNPSAVQRGSVEYLAPGDPTTIGYPSKPGVPRQSVDGKVPDIPSLPISYSEALPLLLALNGYGPNASSFSEIWQRGGLDYKGVHYNIGPSPPSLKINLYNAVEYVTTPQWDTIGIINGTIADEVIIIGNHRDAWIVGGAGDPNSGSAALNEVVRALGAALKQGWKPLRTIVFGSWDGEEYALIGSTEWVEEYLPWLSTSAIAYVNVDVGTSGPDFRASASPLLKQVLHTVTDLVQSPNQTVANQTVFDLWDREISTIGSGSDFTAFQDYAGIPSLDLGFDPVHNMKAVYHYHSNYDSHHWMEKYGDPGFKYHVTMAKVIAATVMHLGEQPIIPLNASDYAEGLRGYFEDAKDRMRDLPSSIMALLRPLDEAIDRFRTVTAQFEAQSRRVHDKIFGVHHTRMKKSLFAQAQKINHKYKMLERQFLYAPGLDNGREWYKHVVFAPGIWTGYAGETYPGLSEALTARDEAAVQRWVGIIEQCVENAIKLLQR